MSSSNSPCHNGMRATYTINRKGKVVGRSVAVVEDGDRKATNAAMLGAAEEALRQAKAHVVAKHARPQRYRKKRSAQDV